MHVDLCKIFEPTWVMQWTSVGDVNGNFARFDENCSKLWLLFAEKVLTLWIGSDAGHCRCPIKTNNTSIILNKRRNGTIV